MQITACRGQQGSKSRVRLQEAWNWPVLPSQPVFVRKWKRNARKHILCIRPKWKIWAVEGRLHTHTNKKPGCC